MAKTLEEIEQEIRSLSDEERIHLLRDLVADLDGVHEPEAEMAWLEETQRRYKELRSGIVKGIPSETVFKRARDHLKK